MPNNSDEEPRILSPFAQAEVEEWTAYEKLQHGYLIRDEDLVTSALQTIDQSRQTKAEILTASETQPS